MSPWRSSDANSSFLPSLFTAAITISLYLFRLSYASLIPHPFQIQGLFNISRMLLRYSILSLSSTPIFNIFNFSRMLFRSSIFFYIKTILQGDFVLTIIGRLGRIFVVIRALVRKGLFFSVKTARPPPWNTIFNWRVLIHYSALIGVDVCVRDFPDSFASQFYVNWCWYFPYSNYLYYIYI